MIVSKKSGHNNFGRLVNYVMDEDKAVAVETANVYGRDADGIAEEMESLAQLNQRVDTRTYHAAISWAKGDNPSRQEMLQAGRDFLRHMDLEDHQSVVAVHNDTDKDHIHIVANRIHPDAGRAWNGFINKGERPNRGIAKTEFQRHEEFTQAMEIAHGWQLTPGKYTGLGQERWGQSLSQGEYHANKKAQQIANAIEGKDMKTEAVRTRAFSLKDTFGRRRAASRSFDLTLASKGLHLEAKGQGGVIRGGSGYSMKLSDLDRSFSGTKLGTRFGKELKKYCKQRNKLIEAQKPEAVIDQFNTYFEQRVYQDFARAARNEEKSTEALLYEAREYDEELKGYQQALNDRYDALYVDPTFSRKAFSNRIESHGMEDAIAELYEHPRTYGEIADRSALSDVETQLTNMDKLNGRYSNAITSMANDERDAYISTLASRERIVADLRQQVSERMKSGALNKFHQEMSQTDSGQAISRSLATSVQLSKGIKQLAEDPSRAPMAAGMGLWTRAQALTQSEGGEAVQKILNRTQSNAKLLASLGAVRAKGAFGCLAALPRG